MNLCVMMLIIIEIIVTISILLFVIKSVNEGKNYGCGGHTALVGIGAIYQEVNIQETFISSDPRNEKFVRDQ